MQKLHSGIVMTSLAYRCGGSVGLTQKGRTDFPFNLTHGGVRHLKRRGYDHPRRHKSRRELDKATRSRARFYICGRRFSGDF